jgi:hypothetical protein
MKNQLIAAAMFATTLAIANPAMAGTGKVIDGPTTEQMSQEGYIEHRLDGTKIIGRGYGVWTHTNESENWQTNYALDGSSKHLVNGDVVWERYKDHKDGQWVIVKRYNIDQGILYHFYKNSVIVHEEIRTVPKWVKENPRVIKITPR